MIKELSERIVWFHSYTGWGNTSADDTTIRIKGTPIDIVIREIDYIAPKVHEDVVEIILSQTSTSTKHKK